uniref:Uncharacterized protein n=1 Tax=Romanomermis culicivorax TaxID=13658 RepID=A0A915J186_ROMCU
MIEIPNQYCQCLTGRQGRALTGRFTPARFENVDARRTARTVALVDHRLDDASASVDEPENGAGRYITRMASDYIDTYNKINIENILEQI